jgi:hypothetical protein
MRYKILGRSGLRVSEFALGTMTFGTEWGWGSDHTTSRPVDYHTRIVSHQGSASPLCMNRPVKPSASSKAKSRIVLEPSCTESGA